MRGVISLIVTVCLCSSLSAQGQPDATDNTSGQEVGVQEKLLLAAAAHSGPLSFTDLLDRAQDRQAEPNLERYPTPPVLYANQNSKGWALFAAGLAAVGGGVLLALSADETDLIELGQPSSAETVEIERVSNGKRWTGVGIAASGAVLAWYGWRQRD